MNITRCLHELAKEADGYGAGSATSRVGKCFGTRWIETFYEDFASILGACEIELEDEDETSGGGAALHTSVPGTTAAGASADIRPDRRVVTVRRWGPETARMERMRGPERAYTEEPTVRSGVAKRRESRTDPVGNGPGR